MQRSNRDIFMTGSAKEGPSRRSALCEVSSVWDDGSTVTCLAKITQVVGKPGNMGWNQPLGSLEEN